MGPTWIKKPVSSVPQLQKHTRVLAQDPYILVKPVHMKAKSTAQKLLLTLVFVLVNTQKV